LGAVLAGDQKEMAPMGDPYRCVTPADIETMPEAWRRELAAEQAELKVFVQVQAAEHEASDRVERIQRHYRSRIPATVSDRADFAEWPRTVAVKVESMARGGSILQR
jgi:hypothetical protein